MKHSLSTILTCTLFASIISLASCELNINTDDECLECSYTTEGRVITEELCDAYGTEEEKEAMRDRMQTEADELDVDLKCKTH